MPRLTPPAQHLIGDIGHTTDHGTVASIQNVTFPPYQFFVSDPFFGAKGDGLVIENGVNITSGLNVLTRTDGGSWTAGDTGKHIVINYAGGVAVPLSTTISGFTNAATVTLTANAAATVTAGDAVYGTDDTAAIQAAANAAVTYAQSGLTSTGSNYAEVLFGQGIYMICAATTKGGATLGNAQITLPNISGTASQKVTLVLRGAQIDSSPEAYWTQTVPQAPSGTILFSTLTGQTTDGTWGNPSVIGGPTPQGVSGPPPFSNMMIVLSQICVMEPFNPSLIGFDMRCMAETNVPSASAMAFATVPEMTATPATNGTGVGLYMPLDGNNDNSNIGTFTCEGFDYGLGCNEHTTAQRIAIINCPNAVYINSSGTNVHGVSILYASVEQCSVAITMSGTSGAGHRFGLFIGLLDTETTTTHVSDPNSNLTGTVRWSGLGADVLTVTGGANLEIISNNQARGFTAAPAVPATTVALANPFWRHAAVTIVSGASAVTAIAVDGTATGAQLATGGGTAQTTVIVPSGKTIALTYTSAPTWKWVLM